MRRFHIYIGFIVWLLTSLFAVSCNDELEGNGYTLNSSSNLHVLVPTVLSANGNDFSGSSSEAPTYNATVDECQINDLRLYAFPVDGNGKLVAENLPAPTATSMLNQNAAEYQLNITPGTYHIYVVANLSDVLSGQPIETEDALKKVVLNYGSVGKPGMPICTNIPMIYEPEKDATTGKLVETKITPAGNKYTEVIANMKFTCVKVKLNLIFDPTQAEVNANFGGKSILIDNIVANKLSPFTNLYWGGKFVEESLADGDYKTGIRSTQYTSGPDAPAVYYTNWEDHTSEAEANNKNDIVGKGNPTPAPIDAAKKWLFQNTFYLPERYISSAADRSYLTINGKVANSASNDYRIDLGHKDENSASEVPTFPRGTYYEITGRIKSLGNMTLDCNVSVKDWTPVEIDADFNHTTLWVSKAKAEVTSTTRDSIHYESNAIITENDFGCDTEINGKDVVSAKLDIAKKQITFSVNQDIEYTEYNGKYTGTAKVWIKAGNIKKYIDVTYNVAPYFDITPQEVVIYWKSDNSQKTIKFKTNLGGLEFKESKTKSTIGHSTIEAACANSDTEDGTFTISATTDPVTTTAHLLYVQPKEHDIANYDNFVKAVKVIVKPAVGNYRINFRAINDRAHYSGNNTTDNYEGTPDEKKEETFNGEKGNTNWADGWYEYSWCNNNKIYTPQPDNHCIYVYTQIGETTGNEVNSPVWKFTGKWPGDKMVADNTNVGWYYKDFPKELKSLSTENVNSNEEKERVIKPGETLVMFSNNSYQDQGYSLHRCPHHLEPGIPLFDYEDREGWIVYDPTSDPTWHIYDEMPTIENINFTIYTKFQTYGWFKVYGVAQLKPGSTTEREQFTIYHKNGKKEWWSCTYDKGWYKTVITLKAVKGDHEKDIRIMKADQISEENSILLFNGNSYEKYDDTGYYDGSSWHAGKPF